MVAILKTYDYVYGNGAALNRRIIFSGTPEGKIDVTVCALRRNGEALLITKIFEDKVVVEQHSLQEMVRRMQQARATGVHPEYVEDRTFTQMNLEEKQNILVELDTKSWDIGVISVVCGENPRFEVAKSIIFRPTERVAHRPIR